MVLPSVRPSAPPDLATEARRTAPAGSEEEASPARAEARRRMSHAAERALALLALTVPVVLVGLLGVLLALAGPVDPGLSARVLGRSLGLALAALAVAAPLGLGLGAWVVWTRHSRARRLATAALEGLAMVPGVALGAVGVWVLLPALRSAGLAGRAGTEGALLVLAAGLLGLLVTPTVAAITRRSLAELPSGPVEAAQALGVGRARACLELGVRGAGPGLAAALLAASTRAMGEASLVWMLCATVGVGWSAPSPVQTAAVSLLTPPPVPGGLYTLALGLLALTLPTQALASALVARSSR